MIGDYNLVDVNKVLVYTLRICTREINLSFMSLAIQKEFCFTVNGISVALYLSLNNKSTIILFKRKLYCVTIYQEGVVVNLTTTK